MNHKVSERAKAWQKAPGGVWLASALGGAVITGGLGLMVLAMIARKITGGATLNRS